MSGQSDLRLNAKNRPTHLGNAPGVVTGNAFGFTGTTTAANGDKLFSVLDHDVLGTTGPCPAGFVFSETVTVITGGTGRFANASGSIDVKGCNSLDSTGVFVVTRSQRRERSATRHI